MKTTPTVNDYAFSIWYSADDECFVAQVIGWPSLMADGASVEEAAYQIREALDFALEVSVKHGNPIPTPVHAIGSLGKLGGRVRSPAKAAAAKANGKLGGRPRKTREPVAAA